jgi:hypothetical protein
MGRKDFPPFMQFLEGQGIGYYAEVLYNNGYSLANLERLGDGDLRTMNITGTKEKSKLLDAVNFYREHEVRIMRQFLPPPDRGSKSALWRKSRMDATMTPATGEASTASVPADSEPYPEFSATIATANECARQATIFLAHQRVDRAWPHSASNLTRSLNLSTAAPKTVGAERMYRIAMGEGDRTDVYEPCRHEHGHSAKFCHTCADHISDGIKGQWQYLTQELVDLGGGAPIEVAVWKPFDAKDGIRIEFGFKKKEPTLKMRGHVIDFAAMLWGKNPIRRVGTAAVPFPTLHPRDVVTAPARRDDAAEHCAQELRRLYRELIEKTERTNRIALEQQQAHDFADMAALSVAMAMQMFDDQRAALEAEEAEARARVECGDLERALDDVWQAIEDSMRGMALEAARREGEEVAAKQRNMLENMEAIGRDDVEREEEALRRNLTRLAALLNNQMHDILERARKGKVDASNAAQHGGLRCPICRKVDCPFFRDKWRNHWQHHGGALDVEAPHLVEETLSTLIGRSGEAEYREYRLNRKAAMKQKKEHSSVSRYTQRIRDATHASRFDGSFDAASSSMPTSPIPRDDETTNADESLPPRPASAFLKRVHVKPYRDRGERPRSATPNRNITAGVAPRPLSEVSFRCSKRV